MHEQDLLLVYQDGKIKKTIYRRNYTSKERELSQPPNKND